MGVGAQIEKKKILGWKASKPKGKIGPKEGRGSI